ncbi:hypothetical protein DFH94DRAFT_639035 [Russula ochroleuca]|jgi:hypothetical protein|uniref:Long chronological lifespan protein 2 n=1 Tax=Russula ochroleuca TaxID=152965 RepID=A0A9P5ML97_9AGAM|nr:hypothetical protein DFH94DRAFT_639035 [Russula ochroleuca]
MSLYSRLCLFTLAFSIFALASAQFQFFNGMFGHQQQQQQPSGGQQWAMHADSLSCSEYLCQDTLVCVAKPIDCPCPNVEDIKCVVPDAQEPGSGTRLCIRGGTDCSQLEKLVKKFSQ